MRRALVVVALVAGCHASDPCAGKSGACLTVEATGSGIGPLDELLVGITDGSGAQQSGTTGTLTPRAELPVQFAALLRAGTSGHVSIDVSGVRDGVVVADGVADGDIPSSGRAHVTVVLGLTTGGDVDMANGGGGGGGGGGDGGNGGVTLTPFAVDIGRVTAGQKGTAMLTLTAHADVTLGAASLMPAPTGVAIDTSSTCANQQLLHAGDTCRIVVAFSATVAASFATHVSVPTSVGMQTATVTGRSPGTIAESLPIGNPPTFNAVFAVDGRTAYAVGAANAVWRRDPFTGWQGRTGPGNGTTSLTAVFAPSDDDVYVATPSSGKVFRSTDRGMTWTGVSVGIAMDSVAVGGSDANTVWVGGSTGDIVVGSAPSGIWQNEHSADGAAWTQIYAGSGAVYAVRGDGVDLRTGPMMWARQIDAAGAAAFQSTWGNTTDVYAVGAKNACTTTGTCNVIYHRPLAGVQSSTSISNCDGLNGVWGSTSGAVYAVGLGGTYAVLPSGSSSWQTTSLGTVTFNGIHGNDGELYIVGTNGAISHIVE